MQWFITGDDEEGSLSETYAAEEGDDSMTYEEIHYSITIRRDAKYYLITVVAPTFIITTICLTGLFVPFSSTGERQQKVTLGLTTLLTIAVVLHMVTEEMPKSPEGTTMLGPCPTTSLIIKIACVRL